MEAEITEQFAGFAEAMLSAPIAATIVALGFLIFSLLFFAYYIYTSFAWMDIAKKLKYKHSWLAWIPIVRWAMILQLGKFHWAFIFLALIPVLGWVGLWILLIIATWRIFEKRKYPGWLSLAPVLGLIPKVGGLGQIAFLIILGFVAWKEH